MRSLADHLRQLPQVEDEQQAAIPTQELDWGNVWIGTKVLVPWPTLFDEGTIKKKACTIYSLYVSMRLEECYMTVMSPSGSFLVVKDLQQIEVVR